MVCERRWGQGLREPNDLEVGSHRADPYFIPVDQSIELEVRTIPRTLGDRNKESWTDLVELFWFEKR